MIPYSKQRQYLLDNIDAAVTIIRGKWADEGWVAEMKALAIERHADNCAIYKDSLYRRPEIEIEFEAEQEAADQIVWQSELARRDREREG